MGVSDVSGSAEPIDAGRATAKLSAYLGGTLFLLSHMSATAAFLDATDASLGVLRIGPVTREDHKNLTTLLRREGSAPVPAGTRRIRVTLTSTGAEIDLPIDGGGIYSFGMADNVKLTLDIDPSDPSAPPPPLPSTPPPSARSCGGLPVTIRGTESSETLNGTPGNDVIDGGEATMCSAEEAATTFSAAARAGIGSPAGRAATSWKAAAVGTGAREAQAATPPAAASDGLERPERLLHAPAAVCE